MGISYSNTFNCRKCNQVSATCSSGDGKLTCRNCGASYPDCVGKSSWYEKFMGFE